MSRRDVEISNLAWADFIYWQQNNNKIFNKIMRLIETCRQTPFAGIGKPEPLRGELTGLWSRRIDKEHRLVYRVTDQQIEIASCRRHYK